MNDIVPPNMRTLFQIHKGGFMSGQAPWNFHQQLETFAQEVEKVNPSFKSFEQSPNLKQPIHNQNTAHTTGNSNVIIKDSTINVGTKDNSKNKINTEKVYDLIEKGDIEKAIEILVKQLRGKPFYLEALNIQKTYVSNQGAASNEHIEKIIQLLSKIEA